MKRAERIAVISILAVACLIVFPAAGLAQDSGGGKYLKSKFISEDPISED